MIEYDFLKILNDFVRVYKSFPLPAVLCDASFEVHWSNAPAKSVYPHAASGAGLRELLGEFDLDALFSRLSSEGSLRVTGALPFSGVEINLSPMLHDGETVGVVALFLESQAVVTPQRLIVSSRTPAFLQEVLRKNVDDMFAAIDTAALKADLMGAGWLKPSFSDIAINGYQILRAADNVAQYAAFQNQPPELSTKAVALFGLLCDYKSAISGLSSDMGIPVSFSLPEDDAFASLDAAKFESAFFNILHNALYFTRSGNAVEVSGKLTDREITLTVSDMGVGIPRNILPDIFRPYFSYGFGGAPAGAGLGLTLAKTIIEAHGGSISVSSKENEGTAVTLKLPKAAFSLPLDFKQGKSVSKSLDRFSPVYVGLSDAAQSPFSNREN